MSWPDLENLLSDVVDGTYGELLEFRPMADSSSVNSRPSADGSRAISDVKAVFSDRAYAMPELDKTGTGLRHQSGPMMSLTNPMISIDVRQLASQVQRKDRFLRKATGDVYEVTDIQPDGQGRKRLELVHVKTE